MCIKAKYKIKFTENDKYRTPITTNGQRFIPLLFDIKLV